ncbi:MAG: DEAD/DEAH box helicase family protein [Patescibacteria group bacterium]|nr:DEAD/DEAH box helicase family protein [Patescibacteria group bacterium]
MPNFEIKQENGVWLRLIGEPSIIRQLSDQFCFEVPNFKFIKKKMRGWDGKIRLIQRNRTYVGLITKLVKSLREMGIDPSISINHIYSQFYKEEYINSFIENLSLPFELRLYQRQIIHDGIQEKRATFLSATSSGKSICIYSLTAFWYQHFEHPKILIIVPSINLVNQLFANFKEYHSVIPLDDISLVFHESTKINLKAPVIISTWQSAYKWSHEILKSFNVVIFDEVHVAKAKEISKFLEKLVNANVRYGFTGTLDDEKIHHLIVEGLFGPKIKAVDLNALIQSGYATDLSVEAVQIDYSEKKRLKTYPEEIDYLIECKKRNVFIIELAKKLKGNTMILFHRIKHGMDLYELAKNQIPEKKIYLIYGNTEAELREQARLVMNEDLSGNTLIIASLQIFSVGVDIPSLKNLILAHPTKSKIRLLQSIGRILRLHKNKEISRFYDLGDNLGTKNYTFLHFLKRIEYYMKENLSFKVNKITL